MLLLPATPSRLAIFTKSDFVWDFRSAVVINFALQSYLSDDQILLQAMLWILIRH